jgi:hypothetical protein
MTAQRNFDPAKLTQLLTEVERNRFWGNLELNYQDGQLVLVRKTETFKIRQENYSNARPSNR